MEVSNITGRSQAGKLEHEGHRHTIERLELSQRMATHFKKRCLFVTFLSFTIPGIFFKKSEVAIALLTGDGDGQTFQITRNYIGLS